MKRQWLIDAREAKGLTQAQLAKLTDSTVQSISNYETGFREPRPAIAKRIGKTLGIDWTKFYE